ncbi:MAG TPA: hypothetical protein VG826_35345 [Pirellulales bacterium]|nr:hypothetical protein [Pirellulales bacterium]
MVTVGSMRRWWRRGHTGFLILLVSLNIALDRFAFKPDGETATLLWVGILLGQTFLMGFWMAFGGLHAALRGLVVAAATAAGVLAASMSIAASQGVLILAPLGGTIVLATYAILLPLRLLLAWRVDFDEAYHARRSHDRMQLGLVDCINIVTAFALLLGYAQWLPREFLPTAALGGGFALFNSLPIALVSVISRPSVKVWLVAATVSAASLIAEGVIVVYFLGAEFAHLLLFEFALVAILLLNLLPLRFIFGLRLFSVAGSASGGPAADSAEQGLAEVEAAWPTLPEAVRVQIVALVHSADPAEPVRPSTDVVG